MGLSSRVRIVAPCVPRGLAAIATVTPAVRDRHSVDVRCAVEVEIQRRCSGRGMFPNDRMCDIDEFLVGPAAGTRGGNAAVVVVAVHGARESEEGALLFGLEELVRGTISRRSSCRRAPAEALACGARSRCAGCSA